MGEGRGVAEAIGLAKLELRVCDFYGVVGQLDGSVVGIIVEDVGLVELHGGEAG